jgi:serine/threonine protein kinase
MALTPSRYALGPKIGSGAYSSVYSCENDANVVIKIETTDSKHELRVYIDLESSSFTPNLISNGIARVKDKTVSFLVLEKFQSDAHTLIKTRLDSNFRKRIAWNIIDALEYIHDKGYAHCDIKPHNILVSDERVVLADFGLARKYVQENGDHVEYALCNKMMGTLPYMSSDMHRKINPSRRSDMESLGWTLVELFGGRLPWRNVDHTLTMRELAITIGVSKNQYKCKLSQFLTDCALKYGRFELAQYFHSVWALDYRERPNYKALTQLFTS